MMTRVMQKPPSRDRGRRLAGGLVLGMVLTIALAPIASAQVPSVKDAVSDTTQVVDSTVNDPGKAVTDTTNKVGDTVTESGDKLGDTVTDTGGKVGDTTGGTVGKVVKDTTEKVGKTVKDTTGTAGSTVGTVGAAAGETVSKVYNDTLKAVDGVTKGDRGKGGSGKKKSGKSPKTSSTGTTVASASATRAAFPLAGSVARYIEPTTSVPALETTSALLDARTPQQLLEAAVEAVKRFAFPLALTILVVAFLLIQNRIDSRDPKLTAASITFEEDLLSFS